MTTKPANTTRTRDGAGRWLKGTPSPNPTGRPATPADVAKFWDEHTLEAAAKVVEVMRTAAEPEAQLRAAVHVLDRRFGRPAQSLDVTARQAPGVGGDPDAARMRLEALIAQAESERQSLPPIPGPTVSTTVAPPENVQSSRELADVTNESDPTVAPETAGSP